VRSVAFVAIVLVVANLALLVGVTTPEKFYFDEVHYVPAARRMLEPVLPSQPLNPDASAAGERVVGGIDSSVRGCAAGLALSKRAVRVARDCRDVSVWPRAVHRARPAVASASIAFFNQMVLVQSRIAMLDISAPTLCLSD
jgi:dolichyl-phosphate-mannose-protein mannosyltransferase